MALLDLLQKMTVGQSAYLAYPWAAQVSLDSQLVETVGNFEYLGTVLDSQVSFSETLSMFL